MKVNKPLEELLDSLKSIEGFPIGKDEDILALSDPPYYTACPNPYISDFIEAYGKPYDEKSDNYHREPFVADVSEGKNDPIYNAHSYHTKVPHKAIMKYIEHLEIATKIHTPSENSFHIVLESSFPIPMENRIHTPLENKIPIHLDGSNLLSI